MSTREHVRSRLSSEQVLGLALVGIALRAALQVAGTDVPTQAGWGLAAACGWAWAYVGRGFLLEARRSTGVERDVVVVAGAWAFLFGMAALGAWAMSSKATDVPSLEPGPVFLAASGIFFLAEILVRRRLCRNA